MAGDKVNTYANDDTNILALQLTTDKTFKGYHQLTLTNYDNTTVPAIAAGSCIEVNGALYKFDSEEAISTTDPVTSSAVADGTVYVCIIPGATTCTAAFTATAPTWSDSKQGWYGTGGQANYRYAGGCYKSSASYIDKHIKYKEYAGLKTLIKATATSGQTLSTTAKILWGTEIYDLKNEFSSSTFTVTNSGYYRITVRIGADGSGVLRCYLYVNSSGVETLSQDAVAASYVITGTAIYYLNFGDTVEIYGGSASTPFGIVTGVSALTIEQL